MGQLARLGSSIRAVMADLWLGGLAPASPDLWESGWRQALQTACQALRDAEQAIDAIDLRGDSAALANGLRIIKLIDLAREIGTAYSLDAHVSYVNNTPVIRVSRPH